MLIRCFRLWDNLQVFLVCVSTCSLITPLFWCTKQKICSVCRWVFCLFFGEPVSTIGRLSPIRKYFPNILKLKGNKSVFRRIGRIREATFKMFSSLFGHCPNSDCTGGTLGHLFSQADLSNFVKSPFLGYISDTKNPGKP